MLSSSPADYKPKCDPKMFGNKMSGSMAVAGGGGDNLYCAKLVRLSQINW